MSAPTLTKLMQVLTRDMGPGLLRGWAAISAYCGKSEDQLRRYARHEGLPLARWGKNVYSEKGAIALWLFQRERRKRERRV